MHLSFRYTDSTIPVLPKSEISSFYPSYVDAQASLYQTWSELPKTSFLASRLICKEVTAKALLPFSRHDSLHLPVLVLLDLILSYVQDLNEHSVE